MSETKKPISQRRLEACRNNGAKSKGPVTPEGKARSSQNARKHGVLAKVFLLSGDDAEKLGRVHDQYILRYDPRDQVEFDLVEEIVHAKWQIRQCWLHEARALSL